MALVADARGMKRICPSCGTRFYDLNKRPVHCPSCQTAFTGEIKVKTRRSRATIANDEGQVSRATAVGAAGAGDDEEEEVVVEAGEEETLVSLDEVEADEAAVDEDEDAITLELDDDIDIEEIDELDEDEDDDAEDVEEEAEEA